ncbi:MAG TPA: YegS/Rv2252/BmrU family lipid kinase [Williamwhitmania sp.]|nr:YegS/Rv2252/BmrU family lipid kinase [Williamwhitmania sp.]
MNSICFIVNSKKTKLNQFRREVSSCFAPAFRVEFLVTNGHRSAEQLALQATNQGFRYIIAVGGDGTVSEVINGVMLAPVEQRSRVIVGVLPWGTGNDFARTLRAPSSIARLKEQIEQHRVGLIDLGVVTYIDHDGHSTSRYFNNIADVGIGPNTIIAAGKMSTWLGATLAFSLAAINSLLFIKPEPIYLEAENTSYSGKVKCVCIANGRYFGSGLGIAPQASITNGTLSIVVVEDVSALLFLRFMRSLRAAKPIIHPKVHYHTANEVTIAAGERAIPLDIDGEVPGFAPVSAKILPASIALLGDCFPANAAAKEQLSVEVTRYSV